MDKGTREQENEVPFPLHVLQEAFFCGQSWGPGSFRLLYPAGQWEEEQVGEAGDSLSGLELLPTLSSSVPAVCQLGEAAADTQLSPAHLPSHSFDHDFLTPRPELLKPTPSGSPLLPTHSTGSSALMLMGAGPGVCAPGLQSSVSAFVSIIFNESS